LALFGYLCSAVGFGTSNQATAAISACLPRLSPTDHRISSKTPYPYSLLYDSVPKIYRLKLSPTKKKKEMTGKCENCEAKSFGEKRP